jgi:hypothetical protein
MSKVYRVLMAALLLGHFGASALVPTADCCRSQSEDPGHGENCATPGAGCVCCLDRTPAVEVLIAPPIPAPPQTDLPAPGPAALPSPDPSEIPHVPKPFLA